MNHPTNRAERLRQKHLHEQKKPSEKGGRKKVLKEKLKEKDAVEQLIGAFAID